MTSASNHRLTEEIDILSAQLLHAKTALDRGDVVDLTPLEPRVNALCKALGRIPADEAGDLKAGVLGVIEELDHLEVLLKSDLETVKARLGEASERQRALRAYGKK